jgi:hypothetical protein
MRYDFRAAAVALAMAPATATDDEIRGIIAAASDVPADKLDKCFNEIKQSMPQLQMMALLAQAMQDGQPMTARELEAVFVDAEWIDDGKGEATYSMTITDEDGEEIASSTTRTKLR